MPARANLNPDQEKMDMPPRKKTAEAAAQEPGKPGAMIVGDTAGIPAPEPSPAPAAPAERLTEAELMEVQHDAQVLHAAEVAAMEAQDAMKAVGRIEALEFLRRVGDVAIAQTFVEVKQSKKYKSVTITDETGKVRRVGDFEDFCKSVLKKSYSRCAELAQNLHLLGPSLYEQAEAMGLANKDYRALRALPEESQKVVKQAIAAESKEQVLDLLQDLAAQNAARQEAQDKENADLKADLEARDKLLADKNTRLDRVQGQLEKLRSLPANEQFRLRLEREKAAVETLQTVSMEALAGMEKLLAHCEEVLAAEVSVQTRTYCEDTVRMFTQSLGELIAKHGIEVDLDAVVTPAWAKDTAKAEIKAGRTEA